MTQVFVLLPAYNEEASIEPLLRNLADAAQSLSAKVRIIVCDDGSLDRTAEMLTRAAQTMSIYIITHKINRGLGETIRDLLEYAAEQAAPEDVIIRMDCDDTHEPQYMEKMLNKLDEGFDVVTASRFLPGGGQEGVNRYRAIVSRGANLFMRIFFPIKGLQEYSCGYRAYRAEVIQRALKLYGNNFIQLKGLGFTCTLEKLVKLKMIGARFAEVPFVLRYDKKMSGSKMVSSITTLGYIVMVVLYYWPFGGWLIRYRQFRLMSEDSS